MRAKNTEKYADYYLLLEDCIKYYHDFQLMYKDYIIKQKDDKIDTLIKKIDAQTEKIDAQTEKIKNLKTSVNELTELSLEEAEQREITNIKLKTVIVDRINKPDDNSKIEQMIVLKYLEDNVFRILFW